MRAAQPHRYGDGRGRQVTVQIADKRLERHLVLDPQLALGEGYMQGRLKMIEGRIYDLWPSCSPTSSTSPSRAGPGVW